MLTILRTIRLLAISLAFAVAGTALAAEQRADATLADGPGHFLFPFYAAGETRRVLVWYYRPANSGPDAPVVFVMHGNTRTGETYRKHWIPHAATRGFILLVPEFSREQFPGTTYSLGNVAGRDGTLYPESQWSYTAIEDIFDAVRAANGLTARTYDLYGHSAGGQFVHRLVLLKPAARYRVAVAANAGWYMMPDFSLAYPHGVAGAGIDRNAAARAFGRRLVVLLGEDDNDPDHHQLARTPEAMLQGDHRLARGQNFFDRSARTAAELGTPFRWTLRVAPGVAHSNAGMAPFAAPLLGLRGANP